MKYVLYGNINQTLVKLLHILWNQK